MNTNRKCDAITGALFQLRQELCAVKLAIAEAKEPATIFPDKGERIANVMLALRHVEDAAVRIQSAKTT